MIKILHIAADEWRYWWRSRLSIAVMVIAFSLMFVSACLTLIRMQDTAHDRQHLQESAEKAFLSQPDRHPHRMIHYGHYLFRTPPPMSLIDPGVDSYTGTSIFLEGHHQNTATFAEEKTSGGMMVFGSFTPAFIMQFFAPLLLILIGYASVTREREASTFRQLVAQGVSPFSITIGKGVALAGAALLMALPLLAGSVVAYAAGEALPLIVSFITGYILYLLVWTGIIILVSTLARTGGASLGVLLIVWMMMAVLVPRVASSTASSILPVPGKLETDFSVLAELRKVGDGHNAADPAFAKLKSSLLAQYGVDNVEDLPVNFKGIVARTSEAQLTDILNRFAEERMQAEMQQAQIARYFGWLSPVLALREYSMIVAGTDLATYHRFLREAEAVRFDFVQSLNTVHAENVTYADDIKKGSDADAEHRSRVSAQNWQVLNDFEFVSAPPSSRLDLGMAALIKLLLWFFVVWALCLLFAHRRGMS